MTSPDFRVCCGGRGDSYQRLSVTVPAMDVLGPVSLEELPFTVRRVYVEDLEVIDYFRICFLFMYFFKQGFAFVC